MKKEETKDQYDGFTFYVHAKEISYNRNLTHRNQLSDYDYYRDEEDGTRSGGNVTNNKIIKIKTEKPRNILLAFIENMESQPGVEVTNNTEF